METKMFCLSMSVECHKYKDLLIFVSHVYLSSCKLTSQGSNLPHLDSVLVAYLVDPNKIMCVCVCVCVCEIIQM